MACLLTDLTITSVDLVEQGANPGAEIKITKSKGDSDMEETKELTVDQALLEQMIEKAVQKHFESQEDGAAVETETPDVTQPVPVEPQPIVEVKDENALVEVEDVAEPASSDLEKSLEQKDSIVKALENKVTELEKSLEEVNKLRELDEMERFARRYEDLGTDSQELAKTLVMMKNAGEEVYQQYLKSLDAQLTIERETGIFKEFGTSQSGGNGQTDAVIKQYLDNGSTMGEAWEKAAIEHPELFMEYDNNYKNGGF